MNNNEDNNPNKHGVFRAGPPLGIAPESYDKIMETKAALGCNSESTAIFIACTTLAMFLKAQPSLLDSLRPEIIKLDIINDIIRKRSQGGGPGQ